MKTKSNKEWNNLLTKDFLYEEYIVKYKPINQIAQELNCGVLRIRNKIKKFKLSRKKKPHNLRISNKNKIERMGFKFLEEYKGRHYKTKFKCYCGREFITTPGKILLKHTKSCGCLLWNNRNSRYAGYKELSGKVFNRFKNGANRRNIGFFISIEDVWNIYIKQNKQCSYTKLNLIWDNKEKPGNASIDRIDNNKPYTIDNIQIVHKLVNMMKRHHSSDFFVYICQLVCNNSKLKSYNFENHEKFHLIE